jgi:Bacterial SH3 domain
VRAYTAWERSYEPRRTRDRIAIVLALIGGLVGGAYAAWNVTFGVPAPALNHTDGQIAVRPLSGAQPAAPPAISATAPPAAAQTQPTSPPAPTAKPSDDQPQPAVVTGTDGTGVVLRASPRDNDWTPRGFMDGAQVQVLERMGADWARVRGANGQEGWVPARYLAAP